MSVSGLSPTHVKEAVNGTLQAAIVGLHAAPFLHYSEDPQLRWEGIETQRDASKGQFPEYADCSSFATWCYWNGLFFRGGHSDIINGEHWKAGWTGTMMQHGAAVASPIPGDAVIYGRGPDGSHTAIYTGGGLVVSNGSEGGPYLLRWNYRSDVLAIRRYI